MAFRSKADKHSGSSSDSDVDQKDSDDEDRYVHWKRVRTNNNLPDLVPAAATGSAATNRPDVSVSNAAAAAAAASRGFSPNDGFGATRAKTRKVNTIWSDVTTEQELSRTMSGNVSVFVKNQQNTVQRGPETYSVRKRPHDDQNQQHRHHQHHQDTYRAKRVDRKPDDTETPTMSYDVTFDKNDSTENLGAKLASALREIKVDLMVKCVKVLGVEKCAELFSDTVKIEKTGGMLTMDFRRRRTPGGVFLQLIREDGSISDQQRKELFVEQREVARKAEHARRRAKRRQQNHRAKNFDQLLSETKSKIAENKSHMDTNSDSDSRDWPDKKDVFLAEAALEAKNKASNETGRSIDDEDDDDNEIGDEEGELPSNDDEDNLVACN